MAQSSRLTAYFAFGLQWGTPPQAARADANGASATRAGRVLDVKVQRIEPDSAHKPPVGPPRQAVNVFLPVTTYAPQPGQGARLVQSGGALGQNFEAWA